MLRRTPSLLAAIATAALCATEAPAAAISSDEAFGSTTAFLLKNDGNAPIENVYAQITPAFKIAVPPADHSTDPSVLPFTRGPLVVLDGGGFDRSALVPHVSGADGGAPNQLLWLEFPGGLQPGGSLRFELGSDPSYTGDLGLTLLSDSRSMTPLTGGPLSLEKVDNTMVIDATTVDLPGQAAESGTQTMTPVEVMTTTTTSSPMLPDDVPFAVDASAAAEAQVVPEPLTLSLWSTGALALGLIRARAYRRGHRPAA